MGEEKIPYPKYVKSIVFVGNKKRNLRYGLELFLNSSEEKSALVILRNPSKADEEFGDITICNFVLPVIERLKYNKVTIVNIIPYYATDTSAICNRREVLTIDNIYEYNKYYIERLIKESSDVFVGWGKDENFDEDFYKERIASIEQIINKKCYCSKINSDKTPRHPIGSWSNDLKKLEDFKQYIIDRN